MGNTIKGMGQVTRIRLDRQGYADGSGLYYGIGANVYACWYRDTQYEVRAPDLATGRAHLRDIIGRLQLRTGERAPYLRLVTT